jgi:RNA polymerase sigma-70 factor (ECF subfamily)
MRAARQGNDEAYRRLLDRVLVWLRKITWRALTAAGRGTGDCEDIVQETLLAMHLKRDTWDEAQPLEPWLRAIARHKLMDHLRRRGLRDHVNIDDYADSLEGTANMDPARAVDSRRLLAALPPRQRRIVEEISLEGRRAADVAARLGMSEGAVRIALHRALKALAAAYRRDRA